jgi:uncharacterized protein (TIGR02246 family)
MKTLFPFLSLALLCTANLASADTHKAKVDPNSLPAHEEHCHSASKKEINSLFDRWNQTLQSGDPQQVVKNYAESSILLPTLSNKVRLTMDEKLDYFEHFLAKKPVGKIEVSDVELDCNTAFDAGIYNFTFGDGSVARARYTYTYKWFPKQKEWLITSHHSSLMPEAVTNATSGVH